MAIMSGELCLHNKFGYCKHKNLCRKLHVKEVCDSAGCNTAHCSKRHPPICKFFSALRRCKFGDRCAYIHHDPHSSVLEEIQALKENVKELESQIELKYQKILSVIKNLSSNSTHETFKHILTLQDSSNGVSTMQLVTPVTSAKPSSSSGNSLTTEALDVIPQ